jgi:MFS family permease
MLSIGLIMPMLLILCVIIVMPESPRWLVSKGRESDALQVLKRVYPEGYEINGVLEDIRTNIRREDVSDKAFGWGNILFPTPAVKRMLIVGVGVAICQQAVGVDAIQYFLVFILEHSGVDSNTKKAWILAGLGMVKLAFVVVASRQFDKRGRRPLMFISCAGKSFTWNDCRLFYFLILFSRQV